MDYEEEQQEDDESYLNKRVVALEREIEKLQSQAPTVPIYDFG